MTDPRESGRPQAGKREARIAEDGTLEQVTIKVEAPDGMAYQRILCIFDVEDEVATLTRVTGTNHSSQEDDLGKLRVDTHLPAILAAELAAKKLVQVRDVRGVETLLDEAKTQAQYGHRLSPCDECGEEAWGVDAAEAGEEQPGAGLACPNCGSTRKLH